MTFDQIRERVLAELQLHIGSTWAIERWDLAEYVFDVQIPNEARTNNNRLDRQVRDAIASLRMDGHLICNQRDGDGYYVAKDQAEYDAFKAWYAASALTINRTVSAMDRAAAQRWPDLAQPRLL